MRNYLVNGPMYHAITLAAVFVGCMAVSIVSWFPLAVPARLLRSDLHVSLPT
jgi:hypothetical protein